MTIQNYISHIIEKENNCEYNFYYNYILHYDYLYNKQEEIEYTYINLQGKETTVKRKKCNISNIAINKIVNTLFAETPDFITSPIIKKDMNNFLKVYMKYYNTFLAHGLGLMKTYYDNGIKFQYIPATEFVPLNIENDELLGVRIFSIIEHDIDYCYLLEEKTYLDEGLNYDNNRYITEYNVISFKLTNNRIVDMDYVNNEENKQILKNKLNINNDIIESNMPNFILLNNNFNMIKYFEPSSNLGTSILYLKDDQIGNIETTYDSLVREIILGKKRIIVPSEFLEFVQDENGNLTKYFDPSEEIYESFSSQSENINEIKDISTDLRIEPLKKSLTTLISLFCLSIGVSSNFLQLEELAIEKSATEVISGSNDTYKFINMLQKGMKNDLLNIYDIIYKIYYENSIVVDTDLDIIFYDNILEDRNTIMRYYNERINSKTMSRVSAIMKLDKISRKEAENIIREVIKEDVLFENSDIKIKNNLNELTETPYNILDNPEGNND